MNTEKVKNERIALWDNIKFILIVMVVIGHMSDEFTSESFILRAVFLFIYSFHMPLFIFISGLFHKDEKVINKIIFYISIGFAYKIFDVIVERLSGNVVPVFTIFEDGGISWFMFALAIFIALTYIIREQNKKYLLLFSIILGCFCGYDQSIGDFLYLSRIIVFYPFYLLGNICKREKVELLKEKTKHIWILGLANMLIWAVICIYKINSIYILRYLFTGRNPFYEGILSYAPIIRFMCYLISFVIGASIIFVMPKKRIPLISRAGENSISIYFWHWKTYIYMNKLIPISSLFFIGHYGKIVYILLGG